jgi:alanine racemase
MNIEGYSSIELSEICNGKHEGVVSKVTHILIDSRAQQEYSEALFIALIGTRQDGHKYINEAYNKGVRSFLISIAESISDQYPEANFIIVSDTLQAFHQIASFHRSQFSIPVIGITGSNGKTIVKEWTFQILKEAFQICRSPKSYNSQIGVPLSVWQLNQNHNLALFEAGISMPDEMVELEKMIQPNIGVFTNIGNAHAQNFESQKQQITEKLKLFKNCNALIYCQDHQEIEELIQQTDFNHEIQLINWSKSEDATLKITSIETSNKKSVIKGLYNGQIEEISLPFKDSASIEDAIHVWLLCLTLSIDHSIISEGMKSLNSIAMRLELKKGIHNCTLINDSYNSDSTSLKIAITYLKQQQQHPKHTLILSDIQQHSETAEELYTHIADVLFRNKIDRLIGIGPDIQAHKHLFHIPVECFPDTPSFLEVIDQTSFQNEAILIKGARKFEFEKIAERLQEKGHNSILEINLNHLIDNYNYFKSILKKETKVMVMVKAFSYGNGTHEIANILEYYRADYLAVAYTDEGIALRKQGIVLPIMVLNPEPLSFDSLIRYNLEAEIYSLRNLCLFLENLEKNNYFQDPNQAVNIHLKMDTGMRRLGFEANQLDELIGLLNANPSVKVASVFSHLAASDESEKDEFSKLQFDRFDEMTAKLEASLKYPFFKHILNSSGILRFPDHQHDMVRLGIGLYGISNTKEHKAILKPVNRLIAHISQIKELKEGETVGYGRRGVMPTNGKTATIPIGYGDGISRLLGNGNWHIEVNGKMAPTIGSICMDMLMINITGIEAEEGDEVVIFGENNTIYELAEARKTIPYEVLTDIGSRLKRIFYLE